MDSNLRISKIKSANNAEFKQVINKTPFVGRMLINLAESYEREAEWHDTDDRVNARLRG